MINKPYGSTLRILPGTMLPTTKLDKSLVMDFDSRPVFDVFKVTSTRFDRGSTDSILHVIKSSS